MLINRAFLTYFFGLLFNFSRNLLEIYGFPKLFVNITLMSYLDELNSKQRAAAEHSDGPLLILAGAGAGKTKTITYRIANLISKGVAPQNILAVTFTNKAANEMKERINKILMEEPSLKQPVEFAGRPTVRTFHSLGVLILRENFEKLGLSKNFSILDKNDGKKLVRDILKSEGYDPKQHDPGKILSIISRQKGDMVGLEEYSDRSTHRDYLTDITTTVWRKYEKKLKDDHVLDFDDLLARSTKLLEQDSEVREKYQQRWKYVHVDEYQDTNEVQYRMTKALVEDHKNICVVGDIDQNIYSWRGATIKNIMNFEKDYPEATEIILEENYRSTQNILKAANEIISKNTIRREKNLFTNNHEGEKIAIYRAIDEYDEATFAILRAQELIRSGTPAKEIAFLYRANFQSRVLEEVCLRNKLPHQVIGTKFFDRKEVRDIVAYIKSALNEKDFTSLNRIINYPPRGIGKATILKIHAGEEEGLTPAVRKKVAEFRIFMKKIRDSINGSGGVDGVEENEGQKPHEIISMILKESRMEERLRGEGEDGLERIENIKELASLAKKYESLESSEAMEKFLEDVSLSSDQDELDKKVEDKNGSAEGVKLMTVHAAKGLEFDHVFVTGLEDGLFPHSRENSKKEDEEEERRLFYVALTRARKRLYLTWTSFRTIYGSKEVNMASEFLDDVPSELTTLEGFGSSDSDDGGGDGSVGNGESTGGKMEYLIDF